jgi:hypothetical protein
MALMKAVQVNNAGRRFEPVERQVPEPGPAQVRIKVEALRLPRGGPHSLTAACRTTITNPSLRATN